MQPWIIYALLSAVFAALTTVFAKAGLQGVNSDLATAIRTTIVVVITWAIVYFRYKAMNISSLSKSNWIYLVLSAFATGASWIFYYHALQIGKAGQVSAIDKGSLLFTILLAALFLGEPLTSKTLISGGLIFAGLMVMVLWK
jgi:transporter family protein